MSNKTPYEIRLDVLKMAQEMMDRESRMKEHKFNQTVETLRTIDIGSVEGYVHSNAPVMYSPEEVIAKASALYNFVSDSSAAGSPTRQPRNDEKHRK